MRAAKVRKVTASPMFLHGKESSNRDFDGLDEGEAAEVFEFIVSNASRKEWQTKVQR